MSELDRVDLQKAVAAAWWAGRLAVAEEQEALEAVIVGAVVLVVPVGAAALVVAGAVLG